jgi:lauroyl/myristoyl acyltransferase
VERSAVLGYRSASWLLRTLPAGPTGAVLGLASQGSYLAWPKKRDWSNQNFGHVLGLPPDDPRVRRLALRAYREYGRYLVELMRVPYLPEERVLELMEPLDAAEVERIRDASPVGGLIITAAHVGNNDLVGAAIAHMGLPLNVVADDSSFPELFEYLKRQREQWHATLIPWRNLRAIFGVLRRRELLGLLVDWGYRSDGIPVHLFDAWTTLPAGPATLAAKTSSRILPAVTHRGTDGVLRVTLEEPISVAANDPADLQRATQAIADAVARSIRLAPEQWYSFKPIWPASAAEAADLERRALVMQGGQADPGPSRGLPRDEADQVGLAEVAL